MAESSYEEITRQIDGLLCADAAPISVLANVVAVLHEGLGHMWTGIYFVHDGRLILGPFQGSAACMSIARGRGVCGTAWLERRTIVVPDVHLFPGHIACSALSRSEIVVPMIREDTVWGVIDIDSDRTDVFSQRDAAFLEDIVARISAKIGPTKI